jgi:type II secretory pathway pseudopilin PulG
MKSPTENRESMKSQIQNLNLPQSEISNLKSRSLPAPHSPLSAARYSAFTLVELLVVIGIVVLLMGILLPTLSKVRSGGYQARSQQTISSLTAAIEQYHMDYRAYPGPIANAALAPAFNTGIPNVAGGTLQNITGAENLVLGLVGGLYLNGGVITYDVNRIVSVAGPAALGSPIAKGHAAYIENAALSKTAAGALGQFSDAGGTPSDAGIPVFIDAYPDALPILYMRANVAASAVVTSNVNPQAQYDLNQIIAYTSSLIGHGNHGLQDTANPVSTNTLNYFTSPNFPGQPVQKDTYILISAGSDRVYGTKDDITNFGGGR